MTKTIETITATNPADLAVAFLRLFSAAVLCEGRDIHPDEFYFDDGEPMRASLIQKTLTDGSTVYNIALSPAPATIEGDETRTLTHPSSPTPDTAAHQRQITHYLATDEEIAEEEKDDDPTCGGRLIGTDL